MKKILINSVLTAVIAILPDGMGGGAPAQAQIQAPTQAQAARSRAEPIIIRVTAEDCARLVVHKPDADAAYQPGVDAEGRPVAAAEGDAPIRPLRLPEAYTIEITVDLQKRFNLPPNAKLYAGEAKLGNVTVMQDGQVFFNGEPIIDEEQAMLAALCQERRQRPH